MSDNIRTASAVNPGLVTYPDGRYEKYESRIRRIAAALDFIRSHKLAIGLSAAGLTAAVLTFMFCIGIFIGGFSCDDFIYGDPPAATAKAFLTDVTYEYASGVDARVWSSSSPIVPGEYAIRAVSQNPFGMKRYSEADVFTLKPRDLTVAVGNDPCQYGDLTEDYLAENAVITGLADGDTVTDLKFNCASETWEAADVTVTSFRVINSDGTDVSAAYNKTAEGATVVIFARGITVSTVDGEKIYDALSWSDASYEITKGSLAEGDSLHITFPDIPADAGSYSVIPGAYRVTDSDGEDITYKYNITFDHGTLTVHPVTLTFTTGSAEKQYDGTPVTNAEWEWIEGSTLEGHSLSGRTAGAQTAVGESDNILDITVTDREGNEVTHNYDLKVEAGKLSITPIVLKFTTESAQKVYDGLPLTAEGHEHVGGELLRSHRLESVTTGERTDAGETDNTLRVTVYDGNNRDVTKEGYKIETECGKLKVTPRPITLTSMSAEKYYDGFPLTYYEWEVTEGNIVSYTSNVVADFTGSQTEPGQSPNTFTVKIYDSMAEVNKTANYRITYVYGTLRVLPSDYDDTVSGGQGGIIIGGGGGGIIPGNGQGGEQGDEPGGQGGGGGLGGQGGGVSIGYPPDVQGVTVAHIKLTESPNDTYLAYLRARSYGDYTGSGFAAAKEYVSTTADYVSSIDFIGRIAESTGYMPSTMKIERLEGCPVLIPYYSNNTQQYFGQSDISFESDTMEYLYSFYEIPDLSTVMEMTEMYVNDKYEEAYRSHVYTQYLQIPETTRKELLRIAEENGVGQFDDKYLLITDIQNFIRTSAVYNLYGEPYPADADVAVYFLDVAKEGICQHFATAATMMYRAFGIPARYVEGYVKNTELQVSREVTTRDGHAWVEIYLDGIGWVPVEVTGSSSGSTDFPIDNRRPIVISAYSASKEYDGMPLGSWEQDKFSVIYGKLLPGHTLSVTVSETGRGAVVPGTYTNAVTKAVVYDENGEDVTDELYLIVTQDGQMTIEKRKLTIKTGSAVKVYDGTPLYCREWRIVRGSMPTNTTLEVSEYFSITNVGTVKNTVEGVQIFEYDENGNREQVDHCYDITVIPGTLKVIEE